MHVHLYSVHPRTQVIARTAVHVNAHASRLRAKPAPHEPLAAHVEHDQRAPPCTIRAHEFTRQALAAFGREPIGVNDEGVVRCGRPAQPVAMRPTHAVHPARRVARGMMRGNAVK